MTTDYIAEMIRQRDHYKRIAENEVYRANNVMSLYSVVLREREDLKTRLDALIEAVEGHLDQEVDFPGLYEALAAARKGQL